MTDDRRRQGSAVSTVALVFSLYALGCSQEPDASFADTSFESEVDDKGEAYVAIDGDLVYPASADHLPLGAGAPIEAHDLPADYAQLLEAERAAAAVAKADPMPYLARLGSFATGPTSVVIASPTSEETDIAPSLALLSVDVVEHIAGEPLPADVTINIPATQGLQTCGLLEPHEGQLYGLFVELRDDAYHLVHHDDYYNGWFWVLDEENLRIDRGPILSKQQLSTLAASQEGE